MKSSSWCRSTLGRFAAVILILPIASGCASIVRGGSQSISINSQPSDASIQVYDMDGKVVDNGKTPYIAKLKTGRGYFSSQDYKVLIDKAGYAQKTIYLSSRVSGWYMFGNLVFGGFIGYLIVDPLTGSMWTLEPTAIDANLGDTISSTNGDKVLYVVLKDQIPSELQSKMHLIHANMGDQNNDISKN